MIKHAIYVAIAFVLAAALWTLRSEALEQIVRPYQSVRASGMGGVTLTTGFYEDNFFGNPARMSANPTWRVVLISPTFETTPTTISALSDILGSSTDLSKVSDKMGDNLHGRFQLVPFALFLNLGKTSYGLGLLVNSQLDMGVRRSFNVDPDAIVEMGPAFTVSRKFLDEDALAVGLTTHLSYRLSTSQSFSLIDLFQGDSLSPSNTGGQGAHLDFDVGATYVLPWSFSEFTLTAGATISNVLGGKYKNIHMRPISDLPNYPTPQPRALGFGVSATRPTLWAFTDAMFAFEVQNIGNNPNGNLFRLIHMGGEARIWSVLLPRLGLYQGYWAAGLGLDLKFFELDLATYGEEMSLVAGEYEDRRIALKLSFHI